MLPWKEIGKDAINSSMFHLLQLMIGEDFFSLRHLFHAIRGFASGAELVLPFLLP